MAFSRSQRETAARPRNLTTMEKLLGGFPLEESDIDVFSIDINQAIVNSNWYRVDNLLNISIEHKIPLKINKSSYVYLVSKGNMDLIKRLLRIYPPKPGSYEEKDIFKSMIEAAIKLEKWHDAFILFDLGKQSHGRIEMIVYACATNNIPMFIELINLYSLENMLKYPLSVRMQFVHSRLGKYASKDTAKILLYKYDIPKLDELETNVKIVRTSKQNEKGYILADVTRDGELLGELAIVPSQPPMEARVSILWELLMEFVLRTDEDAKDLVAFFCDKLKDLLDTYDNYDPYGFAGKIKYPYETMGGIFKSNNTQYVKEMIKLKHVQKQLFRYFIGPVVRDLEEDEIIELLNYNPRVEFDKLIKLSIDKGYIKLIFYVIKDYEKYMIRKPDNPVQVQRRYISAINYMLSLLIEKNVFSYVLSEESGVSIYNKDKLTYFELILQFITDQYLDYSEKPQPGSEKLIKEFADLLNKLFNQIRAYTPGRGETRSANFREGMLNILLASRAINV